MDAAGDGTGHGQDGDMGSNSLGVGKREKGQLVFCACLH